MITTLCPRCSEVITFLDNEDYKECPLCGNIIFRLNIDDENIQEEK